MSLIRYMNYKHFIIKVFVKKKKEFIFLYFLSIKYENYKKFSHFLLMKVYVILVKDVVPYCELIKCYRKGF